MSTFGLPEVWTFAFRLILGGDTKLHTHICHGQTFECISDKLVFSQKALVKFIFASGVNCQRSLLQVLEAVYDQAVESWPTGCTQHEQLQSDYRAIPK